MLAPISAAEAAAATAGLIKALEVAGMPEKDAPLASIVLTTALLIVAQVGMTNPAYVSAGVSGLLFSAGAAGTLAGIDRARGVVKTAVAKVKAVKVQSPVA